jgi:UDP-N-acetylmuramoyl-tripeptide--D-alanyl-D-alanine ligase
LSLLDLTITELLRSAGVDAQWCAPGMPPQAQLAGVSTDSRSIETGQLFFALRGEQFDGHQFVHQALKNGAMAAVVNRDWQLKAQQEMPDAALVSVADSLMTFQEWARYYRGKFHIPAVAITGSSGKTTTKEFVAAVLGGQFQVLKNIKSFNNFVGVPLTLFEIRSHHEIIVTELGTNHLGELDRLSYLVQPSVCVLTNIGHAHLEYLRDLDGVKKAKMEIFNHAAHNGTAIYNADDPLLVGQKYPVAHQLSYGVDKGDIQARILGCDRRACYTFSAMGQIVHVNIAGRHNVYNALAAIAVGIHFGMDPEKIRAGIERVEAVDNRMQVIETEKFIIINDSYNSNPSSCRAALATLAEMAPQQKMRRIAVLGDMLELGAMSQQEHRTLADVFASLQLDVLFTCGSEMRAMAVRASELGCAAVEHFAEVDALIIALTRMIRQNDIVLVKGSRRMRMERVVEKILT